MFNIMILNIVQSRGYINSKETIIKTVVTLTEENHMDIKDITMREISRKSNVESGLINYHFENKEKLIETCVERIQNGIVVKIQEGV